MKGELEPENRGTNRKADAVIAVIRGMRGLLDHFAVYPADEEMGDFEDTQYGTMGEQPALDFTIEKPE